MNVTCHEKEKCNLTLKTILMVTHFRKDLAQNKVLVWYEYELYIRIISGSTIMRMQQLTISVNDF